MGHFDQLRRSRIFKFSAVLVLIVISLEEHDLGFSAGPALLLIAVLSREHDLGFSTCPNRATLSPCAA